MVKWLSIPDYSRKTGLSQNNIRKLIKDDELVTCKTDGGGQVRIKHEDDSNLQLVIDEVKELRGIVLKLSAHLGMEDKPLIRIRNDYE